MNYSRRILTCSPTNSYWEITIDCNKVAVCKGNIFYLKVKRCLYKYSCYQPEVLLCHRLDNSWPRCVWMQWRHCRSHICTDASRLCLPNILIVETFNFCFAKLSSIIRRYRSTASNGNFTALVFINSHHSYRSVTVFVGAYSVAIFNSGVTGVLNWSAGR